MDMLHWFAMQIQPAQPGKHGESKAQSKYQTMTGRAPNYATHVPNMCPG